MTELLYKPYAKLVPEFEVSKTTQEAHDTLNREFAKKPEAYLYALGHIASGNELPGEVEEAIAGEKQHIDTFFEATNNGRQTGLESSISDRLWGEIHDHPEHKKVRNLLFEREWMYRAVTREIERLEAELGMTAHAEQAALLQQELSDKKREQASWQSEIDTLSRRRGSIALGVIVATNESARTGMPTYFEIPPRETLAQAA